MHQVQQAAAGTICAAVCLVASSQAAVLNVSTSGIYDENIVQPNTVDTEASGNSQTLLSFQTDLIAAFAADLGGVVTFNETGGVIASGDTLAAAYGVSGSKTLNFVNINPVGKQIGQSFTNRTAISGGADSHLSTAGNAGPLGRNDFEFSVSSSSAFEVVDTIGVTLLSRGASTAGLAVLTATLDDGSTVSTNVESIAGSNGGDDTFFVVGAPTGRFIESFKLDLTGDSFFSAIDDLAFTTTVVPEPVSAGLLGIGGLLLLARRNRA